MFLCSNKPQESTSIWTICRWWWCSCIWRLSIAVKHHLSAKQILIKKFLLILNPRRFTSIDDPACWLDMMEEVGDVEIRDTTSQTKSFLEHIAVGRIYLYIGELLMLSYAKRHRWLLPKLFQHLNGKKTRPHGEWNNWQICVQLLCWAWSDSSCFENHTNVIFFL